VWAWQQSKDTSNRTIGKPQVDLNKQKKPQSGAVCEACAQRLYRNTNCGVKRIFSVMSCKLITTIANIGQPFNF
jgi:hypothetical protein